MYLLLRRGLGNSHANTQYRVGSQLRLVLCAVELVDEGVHLRLVFDVNVLLNESWSNNIVDIGDGFQNTLNSFSQWDVPERAGETGCLNSPFPPHFVLSPSRSSHASLAPGSYR